MKRQLRRVVTASAVIAVMDGLQVQWLTAPDDVDLVGALRHYLESVLVKSL